MLKVPRAQSKTGIAKWSLTILSPTSAKSDSVRIQKMIIKNKATRSTGNGVFKKCDCETENKTLIINRRNSVEVLLSFLLRMERNNSTVAPSITAKMKQRIRSATNQGYFTK